MTSPLNLIASPSFSDRFKTFAERKLAVKKIQSRRDFLGWLGVATAAATVAGCASSSDASDGTTMGGLAYDGDGEEPLGVSEDEQTICRVTSRDARGPYWEPGAPLRSSLQIADANEPGVRLFLDGRMLGPDCKTPLKNYTIDIWQADNDGNYYQGPVTGYRLRGKVKTDAFGRYRFETILPGRYGDAAGIRPAHIHITYLSPGNNVLLTTQLYFAGDPYLGQADYCTAAGTCNSADPARALNLVDTTVRNVVGKRAWFDAIMPRV